MRYIQHPVTLELIPADEYERPSMSTSYQVMPDIQPYRSQIDGSIIHSRSQHRKHLRDHGCIEIGNEVKHMKPFGRYDPPQGLKEKIIEAVNKHSRS